MKLHRDIDHALSLLYRKSAHHNCRYMSVNDSTGQLLAALVANHPHYRVMEIGRGYGVSTLWMLSAMRGGLLHSYDIFDDAWSVALIDKLYNDGLLLAKPGLRLLKNGDLPGEAADYNIIFIDGDHSYEGVRKDFERAAQLLAPGGLIIMHDVMSGAGQPGVQRMWATIRSETSFDAFVLDTEPQGLAAGTSCGLGLLRRR